MDFQNPVRLQQGTNFEALVSELCAAIFLVDVNGNVSYLGGRSVELLGIKPENILNRPFALLLKEIANLDQNPEHALQQFHSALASLSCRPQVDVRKSDGKTIHVLELTYFAFPRSAEESLTRLGWGCLVREVTSEQEELAQRTQSLLTVANNVRSRLVLIKGMVSTLLADYQNGNRPGEEEYLRSLDSNALECIQYLEYIRDICQLELGDIAPDLRAVAALQLVQSVIGQVKAQHADLEVQLDAPDNLPHMLADLNIVRRVLLVLIGNMMTLLPRWKRIQIRLREVEGEIEMNLVGEAISVARVPAQSDFENLRPNLISEPDLGWHVVRGLVDMQHGKSWFQSIPGKRVEATLVFPALSVPGSEEQPRAPRKEAPAAVRKPPEENRRHAKVLVVEDDLSMQRMLKTSLERAGYDVVSATDGEAAVQFTLSERPDLITLDIYLPDSTGFEICTRLREFTSVPVIIVTGSVSERDMIRALNTGADDYLTKPLHLRELLARVEASLRRAYLADMPNYFEGESILRAGDVTINVAQREVMVRGQEVKLTPIEYKLLYYMVINAGRVLTHDQLVAKVWGEVCRQETQYLWVNISRLRSKIERDSEHPEYVITERGVGYCFAVPLDTPAAYNT